MSTRTRLEPGLRFAVQAKSPFGVCWYCGEGCNGRLNFDHQTPVAQGGSDDLANLVCSCESCNQMKGNRTVEEFRKLIAQLQDQWDSEAIGTLDRFRHYRGDTVARRKAIAGLIDLGGVVFYGERSNG